MPWPRRLGVPVTAEPRRRHERDPEDQPARRLDEDRTLARLRALRSDLIDPTIAVHRGRVVKRTGDGAMVEFRSVVDAVRCAIEMQSAMVERNAGVPPERRIEFRIGIHLGDVVEESDGDLMGDGVNIAARLEGIAQPGGICLSSAEQPSIAVLPFTCLRPVGQQLRVGTQLIDATTGVQLWADRFDGQAENVLELQDHIARAIASRIEPELVRVTREPRAPRP